ncbi:MAG: hypothetical protein E6Q88_02525 [Lysobacteraceae bacterium]|nr:MAG: hypothetical protein E6Q88_02525 [Xanthomonadaceae bacterium]
MKCVFGVSVLIVAGAAVFAQPVMAQQTKETSAKPMAAAAVVGPLTPTERGALARAYVLKWGGYVQQVYRVPVRTWAQRMVPTFAHADADNFRNALKRTTYEGASAMLSGAGAKLSDEQVIDSMAREPLAPAGVPQRIVAKALGSAASDLVYTPVTPCRILDTRVAGGALAGNFTRDFNAVVGAGGNFSSQGGSATNCGLGGLAGQAAVVINLTAVTPTGAGFATVYPFGETRPLASSVNYTAGAIVNNTVVAKLPSPLTTKDFTIYTFATSDFVADIVGYYAPPVATAQECVKNDGTGRSVAANTYDPVPFSATCPVGYSVSSVGFTTVAKVVMADSSITPAANTGIMYVYNLDAIPHDVVPWALCCRVPGR